MPGTPEDSGTDEKWLSAVDVAKLWPVRPDMIGRAASLADVRRRTYGGESRGSYGAAPTHMLFHPEDVHRAAADIAEGRVEIPSLWRTDTPDGERAERWSRRRFNLTCLIVFLAVMGILTAFGYALFLAVDKP